jgi:2-methylisocitrate lyase-like PEP mutase family enzyme
MFPAMPSTPSAQAEKCARFRALHDSGQIFLMPNPWDAGSARLLAGLGFPALATSSFAAAATLGRRDGRVSRDEALGMIRAIVEAVALPVSADLENCFGHDPATVAETIRLAAGAGVVGGSVEDATGDPANPIYEFNHACERVVAAVEAARKLPFPFVLTARCESFLRLEKPDLDDTLRRLQAYEKLGADVLFAPALPTLDAVRTVCSALRKPFNFAIGGKSFSVVELADAGVRRISLATAFYRAAFTGLYEAAKEARAHGTFTFTQKILSGPEVAAYMAK